MAVPKNLKEKLLNAIEALNMIKDLNSKDDDLSSNLPFAPKSGEYNTISYQLGKTLIDAKKDIPSIIRTPKKLYSLYLEDQRRKLEKSSNNKVTGSRVTSYNNLQKIFKYKKIDDFYDVDSDALIDNFSDLQETFGINSGEKIHVLNQNKVFFDPEEGIPIYTSAKKISNISPEMHKGINLGFFIEKSKSIEVVIIISFFDEKSKDRIGFNMLPINRRVNVSIPDKSGYFSLGLKVVGEGFIEYKNITLSILNNEYQKDPISIDMDLKDGISILIPSYKGEETILETLTSIANQKNIDFNLIEIIIVVNGEKDSTEDLVLDFASKHSYLDLDCSYVSSPGASKARNTAISKATKKFTVFCDDDDLLSEEYVAGLYRIRSLDSIGFCQIHDLENNGSLIKDNTINKILLSTLDDKDENVNNFTSAITMIASKVIPTQNLKKMLFNENLRSGEDVLFFTDYYVRYSPKLIMCSNEETYYIRRLRDNSVSRQKMSFDFNVNQRLDVLKSLLSLKTSTKNKEQLEFIDSKVRAQCGFIVNYLKENPNDYKKIHLSIVKKGIDLFPYRYLQDRAGLTNPSLLVISYCYPPFVDTSAVVAAKRVFEFDEICDVICTDMSKVRAINPELSKINRHLVRDSFVLSINPTFGDWDGICEFSSATTSLVNNKNYTSVYSRSFWPASHFAAFEYKRKHPQVKWIAEFSDPIILDIEGNPRRADISIDWVKEVIEEFGLDYSLLDEGNLYVWCELIVYLFADEIIFTCSNQKDLMLNNFPYKKNLIDAKGLIQTIPHPTLPYEYYDRSSKVEYNLNIEKINFAYFGAFYKTRRLDGLLESLHYYHSNAHKYEHIKEPLIHIFTEQVDLATEMIGEEDLMKYFVINPYVGYFDFLKISKVMDILIVNDSKAKDIFGYNPYMPSKLSDYLGSKSKIWAFCEEGSAMDKFQDIDGYKSYIANSPSQDLFEILRDFS